jgi:hypothetical protein
MLAVGDKKARSALEEPTEGVYNILSHASGDTNYDCVATCVAQNCIPSFPGPLARCACLECPGLASVPASREIDCFAVYAVHNSHTLAVLHFRTPPRDSVSKLKAAKEPFTLLL